MNEKLRIKYFLNKIYDGRGKIEYIKTDYTFNRKSTNFEQRIETQKHKNFKDIEIITWWCFGTHIVFQRMRTYDEIRLPNPPKN